MRLFTFARRPRRPAPVLRARLSLESLDGRFCPDGGNPTNPGGSLILVPPVDNPPQIVNFDAVEVSPGVVTISGQVVDEDPGGLTVSFQGPQEEINGHTTTTSSTGLFSYTVTLATDGSDDGTVSAQTADRAGHPSNVVSKYIQPR
jgi:hypothetical protein